MREENKVVSDGNSGLLVRALGAGVLTGIRSMAGPAFVTVDAGRNDRKLEGTVFELLKKPEAPLVVGSMSVGEMVVDKLPFLPNRTDPLPLFGRLVLGGASGAVVFAGEGES